MAKKQPKTALTPLEKSVIKALLNDGWRNQDIQALINTGRPASINFGRISGIKADGTVVPATKQQVEAFRHKKLLFDHVTGLCPIDNERLVRAREAKILAVELFNTPRIAFKAGVFSMLANVAWTYLLHEYYESRGVQIISNEGFSLWPESRSRIADHVRLFRGDAFERLGRPAGTMRIPVAFFTRDASRARFHGEHF